MVKMGNDETQRLKLPGFGMYLTELSDPEGEYFMHALWPDYRFESDGLKLREVHMMEFMNQITDKPEWDRKVFDEGIVNTWHDEAMKQALIDEDVYMSEQMFDYVTKLKSTKTLGSLVSLTQKLRWSNQTQSSRTLLLTC